MTPFGIIRDSSRKNLLVLFNQISPIGKNPDLLSRTNLQGKFVSRRINLGRRISPRKEPKGNTLKNSEMNKLIFKADNEDKSPAYKDPPYLEKLRPKVGFYDLLDLQIRGYDYVVLEKYQSYLHKTLRKIDVTVTQTWSVPFQELQYECMEDRSSLIISNEKVLVYERDIQMKEVLVTKLNILIDMIHMTLPPGVSFSIVRHTPEQEDRIYFKDAVLERFKREYEELKQTPLIGT